MNNSPMAVGMCRCGNTFTRIPVTKTHCSITCARAHAQERKQEKYKGEKAARQKVTTQKVNWKPTPEVLRATESLLMLMAKHGEGKTFHGVQDGETLFRPQDATKIIWSESQMPDEKGVWSMLYAG